MHEVSLMERVLEIATEHACRAGAQRIGAIKMRVGDLSGAVPDALAFAFDVVTRGTIAEGARLEIESVPVTCHCDECDRQWRPESFFYDCPDCGCLSANIRTGREMEIASLEVW